MHDVFISYSRQDVAWVDGLCEQLKSQGLTIWKDSSIPTGKPFGRIIEEAIANTRAVVVVWSNHSVESDWVRAEAAEGLRRGILMPVLIDDSEPPLRYRTIQTADLADWNFEPAHQGFQCLVSEIKALRETAPPTPDDTPEGPAQPIPHVLRNRVKWAVVSATLLVLAGIGVPAWLWHGTNERQQLSAELVAQSVAARTELNASRKKSRSYWWYFLHQEGGQVLLERSVLLALQAARYDPSPDALQVLKEGLVLLNRPEKSFHSGRSAGRAAISPGATMVAWSDRQDIQLWRTGGGEETERFTSAQYVGALRFLPDANYLLGIGVKGGIGIWDTATGKQVSAIEVEHERVLGFALDPSGARLAVYHPALVNVWDLTSGKPVVAVETENFQNLSARQTVDLTADGRYLVFAPRRQIRVWDIEANEVRYQIDFDSTVMALKFDPSGQTLAVASSGGDFRLIGTKFGDEKARVSGPFVDRILFSPDGAQLAMAGSSVSVAPRSQPSKPTLRYGHDDNVHAMAFSADSQLIASGDQGGMVRVWDITAGRELARIFQSSKVLSLGFSADAGTLTLVTADGRISVWPLVYADPLAEACRRLERDFTPEEWRQFLPDEPYRKVCSEED